MRISNEKRKEVRNDFKSKSEKWRIAAVIHDGNWYDIEKWLKVAKVKDEQTLFDYIEENDDILIKSRLNSYRVDHDEVVRWYKQEGLDTDDSIVPSNFPPKLWGNTTETDVFLNAPRRRTGTVSFHINDEDLLEKCYEILRGVGTIMPDKAGRYRAYGLSAHHMKSLLSKGLNEKEFRSLDIKTRAILLQRELIDLPEEWLVKALTFYSNTFAPSILKSSMQTISIYLPDKHDIHSQIVIWVITAMKKFNETASVPFSGYLSSVLRHWPYDLPNEYLGKDLASFQRERKKAIEQAQEDDYEGENVPVEVITDIMDISKAEYVEMKNEHDNWLATKNATTLTWEDSANEKKGEMLGYEDTAVSDYKKMAEISLSAVKAAVDTSDWDSAFNLIYEIDKNDVDSEILKNMSSEFLASFADHMKMS